MGMQSVIQNMARAQRCIARSQENIRRSRALIATSRFLELASVEIYLSKTKRRRVATNRQTKSR
jgi:hypothetical protein